MKTLFAAVAVLTLALPSLHAEAPGPVIGIGTVLKSEGGLPVIVDVLPGSPAANAGVKPEDKLMAIEGKSVAGQSLAHVSHLLRGNENSTVRVTIDHHGSQLELEIKRQVLLITGPARG